MFPRTFPRRASVTLFAASALACGAEQPRAEPPPAPSATTAAPLPATTPGPAPSASVPAPPAPKAPLSELKKRAVEGLRAAFNAGDAKALAELYSDRASVRSPSSTGWKETTGRAAIVAGHEALFKAMPGLKMGTESVWSRDDIAIWTWVCAGEVEGKKVGFLGASVLWFGADGRIEKDHTYFDTLTIAGQLGKLPKTVKVRAPAFLPSGDGFWREHPEGGKPSQALERAMRPYAALERGYEKALLAALDDKMDYQRTSAPGSLVPTTAAKAFKSFRTAFTDPKLTAERSWEIDGIVASEMVLTGTYNPPAASKATPAKKVTVHFLDVIGVVGSADVPRGFITGGTTYDNGAELEAQVAAAAGGGG